MYNELLELKSEYSIEALINMNGTLPDDWIPVDTDDEEYVPFL